MILRPCLLFALVAMWSVCLSAQELLVSGSWLASHLNDPEVTVIHVGSPQDYAEGHIPGARLVRLEDISVTGPNDLRLQLPRVDALREAFGKLGVTDTNRIVLYRAQGALQSVTRVWFTLDYLGLGARAAILDGGFARWQAEGRAVTKDPVAAASATFTPRPRPIQVVSAEWVRMHRADPAVQVIDARAPEFFSGAQKGMMPRAGRVPGAINVPYTSFFDQDGKFRSPDELRTLLRADGKGAQPLRVTYCHIGQQATVAYFAARLLGLDVRLFDGSYQEWSQRTEFPVETDASAGK